jgi:hypothetical protein
MLGFWGGTLATFGYEAISGMLGYIGVRQRTADKALEAAAMLRDTIRMIRDDGSADSEGADRVLLSTGWVLDKPRRGVGWWRERDKA